MWTVRFGDHVSIECQTESELHTMFRAVLTATQSLTPSNGTAHAAVATAYDESQIQITDPRTRRFHDALRAHPDGLTTAQAWKAIGAKEGYKLGGMIMNFRAQLRRAGINPDSYYSHESVVHQGQPRSIYRLRRTAR